MVDFWDLRDLWVIRLLSPDQRDGQGTRDTLVLRPSSRDRLDGPVPLDIQGTLDPLEEPVLPEILDRLE